MINGLDMVVNDFNNTIDIYAASIIEDDAKGDLQTQINSIIGDNTSDLSRIISLENSRTIDEQNITTLQNKQQTDEQNISTLQNKQQTDENNISSLQTQTTAIETQQVATDATVAGIVGQIATINTTITAIETDLTGLDFNVSTLQTKTQNISDVFTTTTKTTFNNKLTLNNGISDVIILDPTTNSTYFGVPIEVHSDINQTSGNLNLSNIKSNNATTNQINIGAAANVGTINLNASNINLNGSTITINGLSFMVNALMIDNNNFFTQW